MIPPQDSIKGSVYPHLVTAVVMKAMSPAAYLESAAQAHFALDAFPFGGCNTVMVTAPACFFPPVLVLPCSHPALAFDDHTVPAGLSSTFSLFSVSVYAV